jgi:hypothetical protein
MSVTLRRERFITGSSASARYCKETSVGQQDDQLMLPRTIVTSVDSTNHFASGQGYIIGSTADDRWEHRRCGGLAERGIFSSVSFIMEVTFTNITKTAYKNTTFTL